MVAQGMLVLPIIEAENDGRRVSFLRDSQKLFSVQLLV
jgi:hypothetical protein